MPPTSLPENPQTPPDLSGVPTTSIAGHNVEVQSPVAAIEKAKQLAGSTSMLVKGETALQVLPPDTSYAVVIEGVEKNVSESFRPTAIELGVGSIGIENGPDIGLAGRFAGYLAIAPGKVRIYKDGALYIEDSASAVSVFMDQGEYVIQLSAKKFRLDSALPIAGADAHFESKIGGTNNGMNPLFEQLRAQGASVKVMSGALSMGITLAVLAVFGLVFALAFLMKAK